MKKVCIITLNGYFNIGNRLQNFALSEVLKSLNLDVSTYWEKSKSYKYFIKSFLCFNKKYSREKRIRHFSKQNIKETHTLFGFDYYIYGSDQIWNPIDAENNKLLLGYDIESNNKIAYAASFGVSKIDSKLFSLYKEGLQKFMCISLREDQGNMILNEIIGKDNNPIVLDPTMLLDSKQWTKVVKKPKNMNNKKFIFTYFLGELSKKRRDEIEKTAKSLNCEIIDYLDINSKNYISDPGEFLFFEKNAELICTDSFHSSVFAFIFDKPFIVYDREEKNINSMNSRIDTLLSKFCLENRRYNEKNITKDNLHHNYSKAYKILEIEKEKSIDFLKKALSEKESEG